MDVDGRSQASFGSWVVWAGEVCAFITRSWYSDPPVRGRQTGATDSQRRGKGHRIPDESTCPFLVFSFWLSFTFSCLQLSFLSHSFCSLYFPINAAEVHLDTAVESHTMVCRLLSELLIHKQFMFPHTRTNGDAHAHNLHLCLISYHISKHYTASLPLAIHFMLTQHQSAGLPSRSTHPSLGCLSQSPSGKTNDVYIHPASALRSPPPRSACEIPAHWKQSGSLMLHTGAVVVCMWSAVWNLQGEMGTADILYLW